MSNRRHIEITLDRSRVFDNVVGADNIGRRSCEIGFEFNADRVLDAMPERAGNLSSEPDKLAIIVRLIQAWR